jgi:uncharacterized protein (DUF58 family)
MRRRSNPRRVWLAAGLYTASLLYLLMQGGKTSLMLFAMLNGLAVYLLLGRWSGVTRVQVERTLEGEAAANPRLTAGARLNLRLKIQVPGFWPLPYLIIRERIVRVTGSDLREYELSCVPDYRRRGTVEYATAPLRRGTYRFLPTVVSTRDVFGLFEHRGSCDSPMTVKVLPRTIDLRDWSPVRMVRSGVYQRTTSALWARETTQIDGVREYIHGDRLSRIHWNATARTGEWKSKEFERESLPRLVVLLDRQESAYRTAEGFELAVSAAASVLELGLKRGMPVGLVSVGQDGAAMFGGQRTPVSREILLDHLIDVEADGKVPLASLATTAAERYEPGVFCVIVSPSAALETLGSLDALAARRMIPCHIHIRETPPRGEEARELAALERAFDVRGWPFFSIARLEDLARMPGVETA